MEYRLIFKSKCFFTIPTSPKRANERIFMRENYEVIYSNQLKNKLISNIHSGLALHKWRMYIYQILLAKLR